MVVIAAVGGKLALLRCFEAGADDFLAKPVSYLELRARLRAVLLRAIGDRRPRRLRVGALAVDLDNHRAAWADTPLTLSRTEFFLLAKLADDPGRLRTKDELLRGVWGYATPGKTRTVDAHLCRLRRKLTDAGADGLIVNRRGLGYHLTATQHGTEGG